MGRLLVLLLILPWWAYLPMAGGIGYLAETAYQSALEEEAEKAAALEAPAPELVDIAQFSRTHHMSDVKEINVSGWINWDYNYELIEKTNGITTSTRFMYVLFGQDDTDTTKVARAVIVLTKAQKDRFTDQLEERTIGYTPYGMVFAFNGFAGSGNGSSALASDALRDEGLTKGDGFVYLEPFFDGRAAALAPHGVPTKERLTVWLIALCVALFGIVKLVFKRGTRGKTRKADPFAEGPIAGQASSVARRPASPVAGLASQAPMADSVTADTPLGRINQRLAQQQAPQVQPEPQFAEQVVATQAKSGFGIGGSPAQKVVIGVVVAAVLMGVSGNGVYVSTILGFGVIGAFWFFVYSMFRKAGNGINSLFGQAPKAAKPTFGGFAGAGGGVSRDRSAQTRAKMAADPFDKLASQTRSR